MGPWAASAAYLHTPRTFSARGLSLRCTRHALHMPHALQMYYKCTICGVPNVTRAEKAARFSVDSWPR
jgi:hypothetical protein